ncbi:MAG: winged helix DNA-binding protein [Gammaproteobacteria bacterium]|nr:winged helix DNA-binding protein [Gammaproteobacteria bacterium]MDH5801295.1 winged helix DNA-binding protein [Gammaproteobacteria bacterium]
MTTDSEQATARLLLDAFRAFENELAGVLVAHGFDDVTTGNFNVLRHIDPQGLRLTRLAKDAQITKQAIGKMVRELEHKGYVEVLGDESDARAKYVRFSKKGEKLISIAIQVVTDMERQYQSILGTKNYNSLRRSVRRICEWHLHKET